VAPFRTVSKQCSCYCCYSCCCCCYFYR